jgi:hypothetical protein
MRLLMMWSSYQNLVTALKHAELYGRLTMVRREGEGTLFAAVKQVRSLMGPMGPFIHSQPLITHQLLLQGAEKLCDAYITAGLAGSWHSIRPEAVNLALLKGSRESYVCNETFRVSPQLYTSA